MPRTSLKDREFWAILIVALGFDLVSKWLWASSLNEQPAWRAVVTLVLLVWLVRGRKLLSSRLAEVGLALAVAGALGNSLDIVFYGGVRDWLPWFGQLSNLADALIWTGLAVWLAAIWRLKKSPTSISA